MIVEKAPITVDRGEEEAFEQAFFEAAPFIASSPGCHGVHLYDCVEEPTRFLFVIEWESLAAHEEGFRKSPAFAEWRRIVGPCLGGLSELAHYRPVDKP
ncbi:MAG: antibiotic biosynthesis monooxygenase family protein [Acidimicrobiales bacterium]